MTEFCFEHVFTAPSTAAVFTAYFDPTHQVVQDGELEIAERTVLEVTDDGETLRRVCRVVPKRQLPVLVRPFIASPLHYLETVTWRRSRKACRAFSMIFMNACCILASSNLAAKSLRSNCNAHFTGSCPAFC